MTRVRPASSSRPSLIILKTFLGCLKTGAAWTSLPVDSRTPYTPTGGSRSFEESTLRRFLMEPTSFFDRLRELLTFSSKDKKSWMSCSANLLLDITDLEFRTVLTKDCAFTFNWFKAALVIVEDQCKNNHSINLKSSSLNIYLTAKEKHVNLEAKWFWARPRDLFLLTTDCFAKELADSHKVAGSKRGLYGNFFSTKCGEIWMKWHLPLLSKDYTPKSKQILGNWPHCRNLQQKVLNCRIKF